MSVSFSTIIQKARPNPLAATTNALREAIAKVPQAHLTKLANGVRVASEENPHTRFATVGIWLEAGTKFDARHSQGLSKVLQFAGFQGTTSQDRNQIARAVDELGGQLTVETGREQSFVALKVTKENVPRAVALLADVVKNARLTPEDVEAAKREVEVSRERGEELIDNLVFDNLHIAAFDATESGGLGNAINGTRQGIAATTVDDLQSFRRNFYVGPRAMLVGAGAVSQKELEALGEQHLGDLNAVDKAVIVDTRYVGGDIRLSNAKTPLGHVAFAIECPGALSADNLVLQLATHIHGRWHRSENDLSHHPLHRYWKNYSAQDFGSPRLNYMPEKAPETNSTFMFSHSDSGLVGGYVVGRNASIDHHNGKSLADQLETTLTDWVRVATRGVGERELEQAKVNFKAQLLFNLDGSTNIAKDLARQTYLYNRRMTLEEAYARIDDIAPCNLQEVLQHYLVGRPPVFSFYGDCTKQFQYPTLKLFFSKYI